MARRDQSLADDLDVGPGRVSTRVALLLRGAERKPVCPLDLIKHPPSIHWARESSPALEGSEGEGKREGGRRGGARWPPRFLLAGVQGRVAPGPGRGGRWRRLEGVPGAGSPPGKGGGEGELGVARARGEGERAGSGAGSPPRAAGRDLGRIESV